MRTTLTLDEDIFAKLEALQRRTGESFRSIVNETLRVGLLASGRGAPRKPFQINARNLGDARINLDCAARALEEAEGPGYR